MRAFAALIEALTTGAPAVPALGTYLRAASPVEAAHVLSWVSGQRPRPAVTLAALRQAACRAEGIPDWLFEASRAAAGSVAETIAHLLPDAPTPEEVAPQDLLGQCRGLEPDEILARLVVLPVTVRLSAIRLLTGTLRLTLPAPQIAQALAEISGGIAGAIVLKLETWRPEMGLAALIAAVAPEQIARPFATLRPFTGPAGPVADWAAFPRMDQPRLQVLRRTGPTYVWTEDGRLLTGTRPDLASVLQDLAIGTVIEAVEPQPGVLWALDLLEWRGQPVAALGFAQRRALLAEGCGGPIGLAPAVPVTDWAALELIRRRQGLWLRRQDAGPDCPWHDWAPHPRETDAVLVHAELGSGGRDIAALTFAVRSGTALVPVARTIDGLSREDLDDLGTWIRRHATARFGPVREVPPRRLYRLRFETVDPAPRRKAGLWLRAPRILTYLPDHSPDQVARLDSLTDPALDPRGQDR